MDNNTLVIRPKHPKGEDGYKVFSVRIKEETVNRIGDIAARTGYSRNELIGLFLEFAVTHCKVEDK